MQRKIWRYKGNIFVPYFNFKLGRSISCSLYKRMTEIYVLLMDIYALKTALWLKCTVSTAIIIFSLMIPRLLGAAALVKRVNRTQAAACCTQSISVVTSKPFREKTDTDIDRFIVELCGKSSGLTNLLHRKKLILNPCSWYNVSQVYLRDLNV